MKHEDLHKWFLPTGELRNFKHERYAHEYLVDRNKTAAYKRAGYKNSKSASVAAIHLHNRHEVSLRISQLEQKLAEDHRLDADSIAEKMMAVYEAAMQDGKWTDANKAAENLARLIGAFHDKRETTRIGGMQGGATTDDMTKDIDRLKSLLETTA